MNTHLHQAKKKTMSLFKQLCSVLLLFIICMKFVGAHRYTSSCPRAEYIIRDTVYKNFKRDPTIPAGLLRLHFHDCFVNGCDASILLDSTPTDGTDVEKFALANNNSARGYEVIDEIKARLESACPGIVSCADIVALAARDSTVILGGEYYSVPTGRYDGKVSSRQLANDNLASPLNTFSELKSRFGSKGLSVQDLVLLSGGHSIGRSKCLFFESRMYNFNNTGRPDPTMNARYAEKLKGICSPQGKTPSPTVPLDRSEFAFDNGYYKDLVKNNGLLFSDQELTGSSESSSLVKSLAHDRDKFKYMFAQSMIKMGNIGWKTSSDGEIRRKCSAVNGRITTLDSKLSEKST